MQSPRPLQEDTEEDIAGTLGSILVSRRPDFESMYEEFNRLRPRSPRSRTSSPPMSSAPRLSRRKLDVRDLEYVSEYDPHLMCPICHVPFIDPIRLRCDHIFCRSCFLEYKDSPHNTTCPSCRASLDKYAREWTSVPRLIVNMCDDIKVKCPYRTAGCSEILARGYVAHHAENQCKYRPVSCSDPECNQTLPWKYRGQDGCKHGLTQCHGCSSELPEWELESHIASSCQSPPERCDECASTRGDGTRLIHRDTCSKSFIECSAKKFGCSVRTPASLLKDHEERCVFKSLEPFLQNQADKVDNLETELAREKARSESLEGGINRLWDILTRQLAPVVDMLSNRRATGTVADSLESPNSNRNWDGSQMLNEPNPDQQHEQPQQYPPFPTSQSTRHLLVLHEGLRNQVEGLAGQVSGIDASLATIDARQSMALMNETLRIKEDLAHLTAGLYTMRSQMNWLLNNRNAQLRGRVAMPGTGSIHDTDASSSQPISTSALPGSNNSAATGPSARPQPRRSSSGHSSQERVKL